jgi:hypothetical protein
MRDERLRQAAFGRTRTAEEIAKIEAMISGVHLFATGLGEKPVDSDLLRGGDINQERIRQATFGYARNEKGEKVFQLGEIFHREAEPISAQGAFPCLSCCKLSSCPWATAKR